MKLKFLKAVSGDRKLFRAGTVHEVAQPAAGTYVAHGYAVAAEEGKPAEATKVEKPKG